ncbi:hypothetical protein B0H13DRAFT_1466205, partial [Mycena leptocephala]
LFDSASGLQITGGTFIDNAGDININTTQLQWPGQNSDPLQALEFDDESEDDESEDDSSSSDKKSSPIVWLHGPAGAGKSAIAQSLCQKLEEEGRLGASFFFKRGHQSRGHAKRFIATIAYQLALHLPDFNHHISQSM